jgi:putative peptidoglycan lipid II flippase
VTVRRLARAAAVVALFGLISRLLGFVREIVLAGVYGATAETDAYVSALLLVNTVAAVLLYTLVTLVIPVFQQERERAGPPSAWRLLWAIAGWVGVVLIALGAFVAIWPEIPAALYNLDPERAALTADLLRIMAPALMLQGFSALFTAMLQVHGRFAGPAAVGVAFNAGILIGVAVGSGSLGIEAAAWGVTLGAVLQVLLQLPQFVREARAGGGFRPRFRHPRLTVTLALALPVVGASVLQQVNAFTDKLFASTLEPGRVAALSFAQALGSAPRSALLFPLLTPLFPLIARFMAEGREGDMLDAFRRAAGLLALVSIPISLYLAVAATEITQLAFGRGKCDAECVSQTAAPLVFYGLAVWANFLGYLLNRSLSAANRARDIMIATVVTVVLTIVLDIILLGPMEQAGLALASAIAVTVNTLMTLWFLRRRFPSLSLRGVAAQQGRLALAGVAGGAAALALSLTLPDPGTRPLPVTGWLIAVGLAGGVVYLVATRLVAPRELAEGRRAAGALVRRRRSRPA